ncbi:hypothetical protein [Streptomyces sp. NPDC054863]
MSHHQPDPYGRQSFPGAPEPRRKTGLIVGLAAVVVAAAGGGAYFFVGGDGASTPAAAEAKGPADKKVTIRPAAVRMAPSRAGSTSW